MEGNSRQSKRKGAIGILMNVLLVLIVTLVVLIGSVAAAGGSLIKNGILPEGTRVDGVNVGGMSYAEAREAVDASKRNDIERIFIELNCGSAKVALTADELGITYDSDEVMSGLTYADNGSENIYVQGLKLVLYPREPEHRSTSIKYSRDRIKGAIERSITAYDKQPVDASAEFHKDTGTFTYTPSSAGMRADVEAAAEAVMTALESGGITSIDVEYETVVESVTQAALEENTRLISEYTTVLTKNENRNTNIRLMCEAVDGVKILPDETLSINELVGKRTEEKGFKPAPAIVDGNITEDMGGGICQLSGTLYNAALLADMEIVERRRHTYPSTYLPVGLDSTLNWNNKDLKIKNASDYPVYVSAKMSVEDMTVTVKLYGQPLGEGVSIEIVPEVIREIKAEGKKIEFTTLLASGMRKVVQAAQTGYEVKVYRNYYFNGELTGHEMISHDTYNSREAHVLVGTADENKESLSE